MKHLLSSALLLLTVQAAYAQNVIDSAHIDYRPYKGKLIVLNESHQVATNGYAYQEVLAQIAAQTNGDTINLIIEYPYTTAKKMNEVLAIAHKDSLGQGARLKGLPIRFIGVDFERPTKKDHNTYVPFLEEGIKILKEHNIDVREMEGYLDDVKKRWIDASSRGWRKRFIASYKKELAKQKPGTLLYNTLTELLFVLEARHGISNLKDRDKNTYARLLEADKNGFINLRNSYNILVHGTCHTDLKKKKGIYNHFLKKKSSPFRNNVYMIGQTYIDCVSAGDYFRDSARVISGSIFCMNEGSQPLVYYFRNKYKGHLLPGTLLITRTGSDHPALEPYDGRFIGWHIHWKVPLEKSEN